MLASKFPYSKLLAPSLNEARTLQFAAVLTSPHCHDLHTALPLSLIPFPLSSPSFLCILVPWLRFSPFMLPSVHLCGRQILLSSLGVSSSLYSLSQPVTVNTSKLVTNFSALPLCDMYTCMYLSINIDTQ